jgi:hypothetical protein
MTSCQKTFAASIPFCKNANALRYKMRLSAATTSSLNIDASLPELDPAPLDFLLFIPVPPPEGW